MRRALVSLLVCASVLVAPALARADDEDEEQMIVIEPPAEPLPPRTESPREAPARRASPARTVERSYAGATLIVDGIAAAMFYPSLALKNGTLFGLGLCTYLFGPPIVHWVHGNVGKGFGAFGIRATAPVVFAVGGVVLGAIFASGAGGSVRDDAIRVGGYGGMIAGHLFAVGIDAYVLAREKVRIDERGGEEILEGPRPSRTAKATGVRVLPTGSIDANGGVLGLGGSF
jgi:hypothetical protein